MTSEVARMPSLLVSHSKNEQPISFNDDALGFQMSRGLDVPRQHSQHFPYCASKSSGFKPEHASGGFTPPGLWSDTSLSPVVESSACSTETESNEDDEFMAGLAEQMTHFMLDNEEEEDLNISSDASNMFSSNWLPFNTKPVSRDTEEYNPCWLSGGWQGSYSHSADTLPLGRTCTLSSPAAVKYDPLDHFHSAKASKATNVKMDFMGERASCHWPKPQTNDEAVGRKIEEFLCKQALKQAPHNNTHAAKDASLGRSESAVGSYISGGSKTKSTSGARSQRSSKLREDERKGYSNQCRHPRQGTPPSWARQTRPQQQSTAAPGHGRMNIHSRTADQRCVRMLDPAWQGSPNLNSGSNMRAVFLSGSGHGRESAGTGVFLPRCAGISHDTKRKPACSTVLLPSRIVQVLNLQMDDFHPQQYYQAPCMSSAAPSSSMANSGSTAAGSMEYYPPQDCVKSYPSSHLHHPSQAEFNLPIDWTY
ncbi:hypothetical protein O6H91_05G095000 [Diphasiastrum complanatum]|uniref:Uncharacterized protein n=2 Tax=Diphasiastrum complanatum TaxID=34168 RepID=A0ACC2DRE3_DIPCM|nr:hypothetical protein O6H91_05G095000 [Diphasiastrum complanatum]KAJ7556717.1 hypothetical protein O6H91_05G095000 [Diphasiastrum complanatum]